MSRSSSKKQAACVIEEFNSDVDDSLAVVPVKQLKVLALPAKKKVSKKDKVASAEASQQQVIPAFGEIWCKLTTSCKTNFRTFDADDEKWDYGKYKSYVDLLYFVMRHGYNFKKVIDTFGSIVCSTLAEKETTLGWETKLFILVQHPTTGACIILQMTLDDKPYKEYSVASDINLLCSDVLRNEKVHYQMTICHNRKKMITIQFPSIKERNFWRKALATSEDD